MTFSELRREVARYSAALRQLGVKQGDRVCGYVGNTDHAVTAYLATATVGAIWSSTSPDLGYHAVIQRFQQIKPKVRVVKMQLQYTLYDSSSNKSPKDHW